MRIVVLQHAPFEGPAALALWARARGHALDVRRLAEGAPLPAPAEAGGLVVMGGPMSANDGARLPWLAAELRRLAECLEANQRVLGVCLGAQLLARAAGARVYPAAEKEIGWLEVERLPAAEGSPLAALPGRFVPFHWHGETFDLPRGARHLARSARCEHQAFQLGRALALQFHPETTPESAEAMLEACGDEVARPGGGIRPADTIRAEADKRAAALRAPLAALLDAWLAA